MDEPVGEIVQTGEANWVCTGQLATVQSCKYRRLHAPATNEYTAESSKVRPFSCRSIILNNPPFSDTKRTGSDTIGW